MTTSAEAIAKSPVSAHGHRLRSAVIGFAWALLAAPLVLGWYVHAAATSNANTEAAYNLGPVVNATSVPPLVMLVMSRDEQLYIKAYTDYTDLDGDNVVDATYNDNFSYSGYFGSNLCYTYDSAATGYDANSPGVQAGAGMFKADNAGTGANNHSCSNEWSGNFLNWMAMSRLDIVRSVLFGGLRSIDTAAQTVLERASIPNDLHAWVKVYYGSDIASFTPFTYVANDPVAFCSASTYNVNGRPSSEPWIRVARGNWTEWGSAETAQCRWGGNANMAPLSAALGNGQYTARVDVCDETGAIAPPNAEPFCRAYTDNSVSPAVMDYKPAGLLQQYGEGGRMRFGLMTGSYADPRSGGRLRRNISQFAGNGSNPAACVAGDEVKLSDGTFCNQGSGVEGIVNTLSRLQVLGWDGSGWRGFDGAGQSAAQSATGTYTDNCYAWGGRARSGQGGTWVLDNPGGGNHHCSAYGNPLSEIYAEALRYIEGQGAAPTSGFVAGSDQSYITGIPDDIGWIDPYGTAGTNSQGGIGGGNLYCSTCSILVLSTGLNSFDSDEIPTDGAPTPINAKAATDSLGNDEGISGGTYLIGRVLGGPTDSGTTSPASLTIGASIDTPGDLCTAKTIDTLGNAIGVCPDVPSLEGSYYISGLAYKAWTQGVRSLNDAAGNPHTIFPQTYTVQLAESLPSFSIPVTGGNISFSPLCQSNTGGNVPIINPASPWSTCALGNVLVGEKTAQVAPQYTYGRPLLTGAAAGQAGSFTFVWEDSTYGSDHDLDATEVITWCVGTACSYQSPQTLAGTRLDMSGNPYNGYDICWRSNSTVCTSSGNRPAVGSNTVLIRTEVTSTAGGYSGLVGYNVSGSTADGPQRNVEATNCPGMGFFSILTGQADPPACWNLPQVLSFTPGTSSAKRLENPLWYAAKYGGFSPTQDCSSGTCTATLPVPSGIGVWDQKNNVTGATGSDGLPDNFFPVHNPANLAAQLGAALNAILKRTGSGTAAAVVSNSVNGAGLTYRAQYQTFVNDNDTPAHEIFWSGDLSTLWVDSFGLLREDANANDMLDDYATDPVVVFYSGTTPSNPQQHALFNRCTPSGSAYDPNGFAGDPANPGNYGFACTTGNALSDLKTVWDAQQQLWDTSGGFTNANIVSQRTYTSAASGGRYIFTWIDDGAGTPANAHNGVVDSGEQTDFVWSGATGTAGFYGATSGTQLTGNLGFLNTNDPVEAQNIVDWIRGAEVSGMRNRTIDQNALDPSVATGTNVVARLGDIIDSTPLVVGTPAEAFDLLYGDTSYATFRAQYRDRRQMVYVGANDGMLHAFNGGFFNAAEHAACTLPPDAATPASPCATTSTLTADALGSEVWAYVPGDLLAHVRWLTDTNYKAQHVFYVDGSPVATDAKVFTADATHPGGWGTILVVPFRLGGGMIEVPTAIDPTLTYDPNNCTTANNCTMQTSYSAYVVLDVTDPEQPPKLLAELHPASDDGNGQSFTTSEPAFAVIRDPASGNPDEFYMFIGSGPTGTTANPGGVDPDVKSSAPLRLYAYNLASIASGTVAPLQSFDYSNGGTVTAAKNSFAGDLIASDFDLDDKVEAVYFGSVQNGTGTPMEFGGGMWKLQIAESTTSSSWTPESFFDTAAPVTIRPTLGVDNFAEPVVYWGTGRVLSKGDLKTTGQQRIYGMIDPELLPSGSPRSGFSLPLALGDLLDVSNAQVCVIGIGTCTAANEVTGVTSITTFTDLQALFLKSKTAGGKAGFYYDLNYTGTSPAERVPSAQALLGGVLVTNTYTPGTDVCNDTGTGREFAFNFITGTADPGSTQMGVSVTTGVISKSVSLGAGLPASPSLHVGTGTGNRLITACTQTSTGAVICQQIGALGPVQSGETTWREPVDQ